MLRVSRKFFEDNLAECPAEFVQQVALKLMQQTPTVDTEIFRAMLPVYIEVQSDDV